MTSGGCIMIIIRPASRHQSEAEAEAREAMRRVLVCEKTSGGVLHSRVLHSRAAWPYL